MRYLTRPEELVLLTVYQLRENSSLIKIRQHLIEKTGKEWSVSSVYVPLDRLTRAGYLESYIGEPSARRGGKAVKYYKISENGREALSELKSIHDTMWRGIDNLVFEG